MSVEVLWEPTPASMATTNLAAYVEWLRTERDLTFTDYASLHAWSTSDTAGFWESLWSYYGVDFDGAPECVVDSLEMPGARWFPGVRLNFAEHLFGAARTESPAIIVAGEGGMQHEISWEQLRSRVAALSTWLREVGVEPGDRVAAYLSNTAEAVVAFLATASVGAVWSVVAPDFGTRSVVDRLAQLEPTVLIATDGYAFGGKWHDRQAVVAELQRSLPSLRRTVLVRGTTDRVGTQPVDVDDWHEIVDRPAQLTFDRVPFEHPLWVVFSSGTTGVPKGIVHGHGGVLLEQLKYGRLGLDLQPGDRYFFYVSTAWVVWNAHFSALLAGATLVVYDGSPAWPDPMGTLRVAAQVGANVLGVGAAYVTAVRKAGVRPIDELDLTALQHLMVTGSPLPPPDWAWVSSAIGPQVRLDPVCGGTDVATSFMGGSPWLPVTVGEIPGAHLGCAVEAWDPEGQAVVGEVGELVVTKPMPTMPIRFWNDPDDRRYRETYFETYPGVWRHGDWIRKSDRGTIVVEGRSDSTLNRLGVRMGSADIYAVVEQLPDVLDSLVVGVEQADGGYYMPLFVVLPPGASLEAVRADVRSAIMHSLTRRHLPDEIVAVPAIPRTLTGKKLEVPIKRLLQGQDLAKVASRGAVDQPDALTWFAEFGAKRARAASDQLVGG